MQLERKMSNYPRQLTFRVPGKGSLRVEYPKPSSEYVRRAMQGNQARNTKPEMLLRKALWHQGQRGYRLNWREVPGKPDIAFPGKKVAIFIHGCFWHRCPYCRLMIPRKNRAYWTAKLLGNQYRDSRTRRELKRLGWRAIVIWECRLKRNPLKAVTKVIDFLTETNPAR